MSLCPFVPLSLCPFVPLSLCPPQNLNMIERLSAEPIQQKQGLRENHSTSARDKD